MASAYKEQCCSICELQHLTNSAEEWCPECDEYLCSNCKIHHKLAKATRRHKTVEISHLEELPSFVSAIKIECDEHHENYEYFCPKHEIPICVICAKEHTHCGNLIVLRKLECTKASPSMVKLEENVRDIQQNIQRLLQNCQLNLSKLKDQEANCRENVKEIRLKINQHLDRLEKKANEEIDTTYTKHKSEVEHIVEDLSERKIKIETIQKDTEKIKDHASEIQTFLSIQTILKEIKEEETQMLKIGQDGLKEIEISFLPALSCTSVINMESFGKLKTNIKRADIGFVRQEDSEAQLVMPRADKKDIDQIILTKKLGIALPSNLGNPKIECCCNIEERLILLADQGQKSRILVLKSNGALAFEIPLQQKPNGVVYINKTVYVSSFSSMTLTSIDFETRKVKKRIGTGHKCDAIAVAGDKILLHLTKVEYKIYDLNLVEVGKIPICMECAPFLSYCDEKIYFAQWRENTVYCYNMAGIMIWKFQNEDIRGPNGIAIDTYGNLFVCGFYSNSISVITPNGKHSRNILNLTDVLTRPSSIHYNHISKQLIVSSNSKNKILVYDVSY